MSNVGCAPEAVARNGCERPSCDQGRTERAVAPNVGRLSAGFGGTGVTGRDMPGRYAPAETLFNGVLDQTETVETEGPRLSCGRTSAGAGQRQQPSLCSCGPRCA